MIILLFSWASLKGYCLVVIEACRRLRPRFFQFMVCKPFTLALAITSGRCKSCGRKSKRTARNRICRLFSCSGHTGQTDKRRPSSIRTTCVRRYRRVKTKKPMVIGLSDSAIGNGGLRGGNRLNHGSGNQCEQPLAAGKCGTIRSQPANPQRRLRRTN